MNLYSSGILIVLFTGLTLPSKAMATEYTCTIKTINELNENGYFVTHGWAANYLNREFTVEAETGKVTKTTALKQRLSNFSKHSAPITVNKAGANGPLRVFTHFQESGKYALLEIQDTPENSDNPKKPYFYHTDIGMLLGGSCEITPE